MIMRWIGIALTIAAALAIIAVIPLACVVRLRRRREMRRLAESLGLALVRGSPRFPGFWAWHRFHDSTDVSYPMEGVYRGRSVVVYDAGPLGGKIKSRSSRRGFLGDRGRTSVCLTRFDFYYPDLIVWPRTGIGLFGDAGGRIETQDVRFECEEFNRLFRVRCSDAKFAHAVLDPRAMEWLMRRPGLRLALVGGWLALKTDDEWSPDEFVGMLDAAAEVLDAIPAWVQQEYHDECAWEDWGIT